jgi:hypothetical protein
MLYGEGGCDTKGEEYSSLEEMWKKELEDGGKGDSKWYTKAGLLIVNIPLLVSKKNAYF